MHVYMDIHICTYSRLYIRMYVWMYIWMDGCIYQADARKEPMPDPGPLENPERIDYTTPFKRYPPGHDIYAGSHLLLPPTTMHC